MDLKVMRAGAIDIGSNSTKMLIGENYGGDIKVLESLRNIVPIGRHTFFKKPISQQTINQAVSVLNKYKQILEQYEVQSVKVIATAAVREARNRDIFIDTIMRRCGFNIELLTAGDVVYYIDSYLYYQLRNTYPIHEKKLLIVELGSGNVDISVMEKGFTLMNIGLPIGTMRFKELMNSLEGNLAENWEAVKETIENEFSYLKRNITEINIDDIILVDEHYSQYLSNIIPREQEQKTNFYQISEEYARALMTELIDRSSEEVESTFKITPEVADTITGYAIIVNTLFSLIRKKYIYVLETHLAEAVLANILLGIELGKRYDKTHQLISMANFICRRYNVDFNHVKHVAELSKVLFNNLKDQLGLTNDDLLYLTLAAYLHDIGFFIHNRSHHKHTEYIITSFKLFRLTEDEIKIIACIGRYHRGALPSDTHLIYNSLALDKQILVQKLSALLRIANSLDRSHKQKVKKLEVELDQNQDVKLLVNTTTNFVLEKAEFADNKEYFEEVTGNKISLIQKGL